jgi:nucleoid-associated protein YgaU
MALELVRDLIKIDQVIGEEITQAMVEGDVVVPDSKPDVDKVLSTNGWVVITDKEVVDNKVILEGIVNVKSLYISHEGEQPLYHMEGSFGFTQQIELPDITNRMEADVQAEIEHVDSSIVNGRKLYVKCVLNISGRVFERTQIDIIKDVKGIEDIQVLRDYMEMGDTIGENISRATVKQEFEIPADKPSIKEILTTDITIGERESRITENRIVLQGMLKMTTLYIGGGEDNSINSVEYQMPFSHYIEIAGAMPGMKEKMKYLVEDHYSTVRENEEGQIRAIEYEAVVKIEGKVETVQPVELLTDAYSPSTKLETDRLHMKFKKPLDHVTDDIIVKEEIDLSEDCPQINEICNVKAVPVLTDFGISGDQGVIEGVLCIEALYLTENHEDALYVYKDEIPFRHTIQLPEEDDRMELDVDLYLDDLQYRSPDNCLLDIRGKVKVEADINKTYEKEVLSDIQEAEEGESFPAASIVVYTIQTGDNLWKIAKRFNTTIEELVNINNIEEPDNLVSGDKLIISRIVKYQLS